MPGDLSLTLDLDAKRFFSELQAIRHATEQTAQYIEAQGKRAEKGFGLGNIGRGFKEGLAALGIGRELKNVIDFGDQIYHLSRRFDVSTDAIQKFGRAAESQFGLSLESFAKFVRFVETNQAKALLDPSSKQAKAFERAGFSRADLEQNIITEEGLGKLGGPTVDKATLRDIGGRSGGEFQEFLRAINSKSVEFGDVIKPEDIAAIHDVSKAMKELHEQLVVILGSGLAGVFKELAQDVIILGGEFKALGIEFNRFIAGQKGFQEKEQDRSIWSKLNPFGFVRDLKDFGSSLPQGTSKEAEDARAEAYKKAEELRLKQFNIAEPPKPPADKAALLAAASEGDEKEADKEEKERDTEAKLAERERKKEERDKERDRKAGVREAAQREKEAVDDRNRQEDHEAQLRKERLNPAGLSLQDFAKEGRGRVQALAQEALREQEAARRDELGGNLFYANQHQDRAEQIKKSLGLPNKIDQEDAFKRGMDKSELLRQIRDNTKDNLANK